jgi:pseudouridylate synthase
MNSNPDLVILPEVQHAIKNHMPVVALESAVITNGLPRPQNLELSLKIQQIVRDQHAIPAIVALLNGKIRFGLIDSELEVLASSKEVHKISSRDFAIGIRNGWIGGTTVAGTLLVAQLAGVRVFATGGIGGVHQGNPFDVSADLQQMAQSPVMVVCAGAKAILDLPATLEVLESRSIPVIGYKTDEFPAFYTQESGLSLSHKVNSPDEIADIANIHWNHIREKSAILIANPPPKDIDIGYEKIKSEIQKAIKEAEQSSIKGAALTPFLLGRLNELTSGSSLKTNIALLESNANLAARIAVSYSEKKYA